LSEPAIQSLKPILVLNIILASFFFAGGYALAYFTAPRVVERIVEKQPIVYNQTRVIVINETQETVIIINVTRIINNTPGLIRLDNISYARFAVNITDLSWVIIPLMINRSLFIEVYFDLTAWCPDLGKAVNVPVYIEFMYNVTHFAVHWGAWPVSAAVSGVRVTQYHYINATRSYYDEVTVFGMTNWFDDIWSLENIESIAYTVNIANYYP